MKRRIWCYSLAMLLFFVLISAVIAGTGYEVKRSIATTNQAGIYTCAEEGYVWIFSGYDLNHEEITICFERETETIIEMLV